MKLTSVLAGAALIVGASQAHATLVFLGPDTLGGQGLGAVETVLTMQSQGSASTESGCVAAGVGGTTVTGAAACPAAGPFGLTPFTGGDEQAANEARSASSIGLTDFADLRILFNPSENNNATDQDITLDNLSLTLWDPATGSILDAYYIDAAINFPTADPGTGNAGFFFGLDAGQAAQANLILGAFPGLFIGLAANASDATGGHETFSIGTVGVPEPPPITVPEPTMTGIAGIGLVGIGMLSRRRRS